MSTYHEIIVLEDLLATVPGISTSLQSSSHSYKTQISNGDSIKQEPRVSEYVIYELDFISQHIISHVAKFKTKGFNFGKPVKNSHC